MSAGIGSFSCVAGDVLDEPENIPGFAQRWREILPGTAFEKMGTGTFARLGRPVLDAVADCVGQVLAAAGIGSPEVDRLVLATSDACLARLGADFAAQLLHAAGLISCVPTLLSHRQCCSSIEALRYGWGLLDDPTIEHVVVVAFDFTPDDLDRVRTFAVFGDAAAGCLISRSVRPGSVELLGCATTADFSGMTGEDSFRSRQAAARSAVDRVLDGTGARLSDVAKVFAGNLYAPVATFNALAAGVSREQLCFLATMQRFGHCGNADWLINLADHATNTGLDAGTLYLAQSSAPGFFACALLRACPS